MAKKLFVLDTNVVLHDFNSVHAFQDNDIAIPITVLEEVDRFKTGHSQINFNARKFTRILDGLSGDKLLSGGASLGKGKGKMRIITTHLHEPEVKSNFSEDNADHRILSVALFLTKKEKKSQVILVSKDVNLRLKAKSFGITSQDYFADKVGDLTKLYTGRRYLSNFDCDDISRVYHEEDGIPPEELEIKKCQPNEYYILKNCKKSILAYYNHEEDRIKRVEKHTAYRITPRNAEQAFALHALMNPDIRLVSLSGKAGTGKTLLALASALECKKNYQQILLARPIVPLSNKDLGFLPGDVNAKIDPYMQPLYDNLSVIKNQYSKKEVNYKRIGEMLKQDELVISPLAYIRGRSLSNIFFIVDEAQNLTPHEIKTIITRAGEGTKFVFTGDPYQIDTPYLDAHSNGLTYLIDRMKGQDIYAHITLEKGERSALADLASDLL